MSDKWHTAAMRKWYTAEQREDGYILIRMPGMGYHLDVEDARKLYDSLNDLLLGEDDDAAPDASAERD